ncbi:sporulation integral membrane protein YlbJ [Evansella caseinilytica]|uniref:Sporulation integral membrane protein YlbJ n=1 Tax=Evansella caseinilytica TaxID=1503961 RepID=A0A1H3MKS9_9BACI|nr:sporulation integral membrane protein YlbJ [Evansella caseinilytica]SDY76725.1 sporulation integral membrane protein YlbJ [Evansella caseinilytica]
MRMPISLIKTMVYGTTTTFLAFSFIIFPKEAYEASIRGLTMWWDVVFPSLLPFFIMSEFLIRFGVVSFIGALFEPVMRPLFRVPGAGGFVWAMGLASGFPAGAKLTARLRQEKKITAIEGERLVSFSNASNPLFIFGAISVGFFHDPALGVVLAFAHYVGNIIVGLTMRFYGDDEQNKAAGSRRLSLTYALRLMHAERLKDKRPFGKLMGDAVQSAIQTLLMIGGFIVLFSVLNQILGLIHFSVILSVIITIILGFIQMPTELSPALISGLFEITLGSQLVSLTNNIPLLQQAIIVSFILAFNGFSVQAQVASILSETDIRFRPFFFARCFHGFVAAVITYYVFDWLYVEQLSPAGEAIPAFHPSPVTASIQAYEWLLQWGGLISLSTLFLWVVMTLFSYKK